MKWITESGLLPCQDYYPNAVTFVPVFYLLLKMRITWTLVRNVPIRECRFVSVQCCRRISKGVTLKTLSDTDLQIFFSVVVNWFIENNWRIDSVSELGLHKTYINSCNPKITSSIKFPWLFLVVFDCTDPHRVHVLSTRQQRRAIRRWGNDLRCLLVCDSTATAGTVLQSRLHGTRTQQCPLQLA